MTQITNELKIENSKIKIIKIFVYFMFWFFFYNILPYIFLKNIVTNDIAFKAIIISITGITLFIVGFFRKIKSKSKSNDKYFINISKSKLYIIFILSILIALISDIFYLVMGIIAAVISVREIKKGRYIYLLIILTIILSFFLLQFTRMYLLIYLITIFLSLYIESNKFHILSLILFGALSIGLLITMREYRSFEKVDKSNIINYFNKTDDASLFLKSIDTFHTYEMYLFVIRDFPEKFEFIYGVSLLKPLFSFIPRAVWEKKPENLTNSLPKLYYGNSRGYNYSSGMTIIGEFYINFGIIGVLFLNYLFGYISGYFVKFFYSNQSDFKRIIGLSYLAIFPSLMRGGINTTVILFAVSVFFIFIILLILKNIVKSRSIP